MKAHVKTREEKQIEEDRKATNRVFKIALIAISDELGIGAKRLHRVMEKMSDIGSKLYETPENWYYADEYLIDRCGLPFEHEEISERQKAAEQVHKMHGKKWRKY